MSIQDFLIETPPRLRESTMKNLIPLLLLISCATAYQPSGWGGGYTDQRLAADMFRVRFIGNGYTSRATVEDYLMRRCAEITVAEGKTHFMKMEGAGHSDTSIHSAGGGFDSVTRHSGDITIKVLNNPPAGSIAYDASVILAPYAGAGK